MAVYSQYNPSTGQFEYFQGAPVQSYGDPSQWDWSNYGQADPQAYPDYWARPDGSLLAQAMQAGLGWTAPRAGMPAPAPALEAYAPFTGQMLPPELRYQPMSMQEQHMRANAMLGGNPYGLSRSPLGRAVDWMAETGRRASEAQDWAEGIY